MECRFEQKLVRFVERFTKFALLREKPPKASDYQTWELVAWGLVNVRKNWKGLWQPSCRARGRLKLASRKWLQSRKLHFRKNPKVIHESTGQRVESCVPTKHEGHIAGKVFTSMSHYNLVHNFSRVSSNEDSGSRGCRGQGIEKAWDDPSMAIGKSQEQEEGFSGSTKRKKESPLCHIDGDMSSQECGS